MCPCSQLMSLHYDVWDRECSATSIMSGSLFVILWTVASQAPLSMGFSRQEYWSRLPGDPSGDLPSPGIEATFPVAPALEADSLPLSCWGSFGVIADRNQLYINICIEPSRQKWNRIRTPQHFTNYKICHLIIQGHYCVAVLYHFFLIFICLFASGGP